MNFYITIGDIQNRIAEFHQNNDMTPDFPEILRLPQNMPAAKRGKDT